jgi:hypothetical protein
MPAVPLRRLLPVLSIAIVAQGCRATAPRSQGGEGSATPAASESTWWKGNLHTHSLWSDGVEYPEPIAAWYRDHGYHFVAFTEHDMLQSGGDRWIDVDAPDDGWPPRNASARAALPGYRAAFGDFVDERTEGGRRLVRLRPLAEYRHLFESPGRFLLLMGEEITDREGAHVNVIESARAILPRGGAGPAERIRNNLAAVAEQARETGTPLLAFVNHPNYVWALTAEEIAAIDDARFFEVYNGHLLVNNAGDEQRAGTERMWDVVLALRLSAGRASIYGMANDDAHDYPPAEGVVSRPGRGWIQVRASALTADDIIAAVRAGDFYASTGVVLRDVACDAGRMRIEVEPEPDASYSIAFIGTRRGDRLKGRPVLGAQGDTLRTTRDYGHGVGAVLAEVEGTAAEYAFTGDELYVRARVVSTAPHVDPTTGDVLGVRTAWTQPVRPVDASRAIGRCVGDAPARAETR